MAEIFDLRRGGAVVDGRVCDNGQAFEIRLWAHEHHKEPGTDCTIDDAALGEPAVHIKFHDSVSCDALIGGLGRVRAFLEQIELARR